MMILEVMIQIIRIKIKLNLGNKNNKGKDKKMQVKIRLLLRKKYLLIYFLPRRKNDYIFHLIIIYNKYYVI
jgi:hypothetical protein